MEKRVLIWIMFLFITIFMINIASAEIILSQPKSVYSLGDTLDLNIEVSEIKTGFLEVNLECGENETFSQTNLYNSIISEKNIILNIPLTPTYIKTLRGNCKIITNYDIDTATTQEFEISGNIDVVLNLDELNIKPGQEIEIRGEGHKKNGQVINGFIEIDIIGTDLEILRNIEENEFNIPLSLPEDIEGKDYSLFVRIYEKVGEEITNEGTAIKILGIAKEPTKIDIAINSQSIMPGEDLVFKVILYDQANKQLEGDIKVDVKNSEEDSMFNEVLSSNEERVFKIENDFLAGYWTIKASSLSVKAKKLFYVEENEAAEFKLENATLIITNIGNAAYQKAVQIVIGDELEIRQMNLDMGEESRFRLIAPDGSYNVKVSDGVQTLEFETVSLTGNAIGVLSIRRKAGVLGRYPIVWLFLIVIFGLFVLMIINRVIKKRFVGYRPRFFKSKEKIGEDKKGHIPISLEEGQAEHSLVLKGNKEESAVLALKLQETNKNLTESLVSEIRNKKGIVYHTGEYILGIFIPSMTKTNENELKAVKTAKEMERLLNANKAEFGIGINSGKIISQKDGKGLKFTSLGNTLNLAKKISNASKSEILLSDVSSKKARNIIKTEKKGEHHSIKSIVDREKYKKFVDDFLKSQKSK